LPSRRRRMSDGDETKAARLLPADGGSSSELIGQWIGDLSVPAEDSLLREHRSGHAGSATDASRGSHCDLDPNGSVL